MDILVDLSSLLLSQALVTLLEERPGTCHAAILRSGGMPAGFLPDAILLDVSTLEHLDPARWAGAKLILLDTGLPEHQITRLLLTYRLDGVISSATGQDRFHKALEAIQHDQVWVDNDKLKALMHNPPPASQATGAESFSRREREIAHLVADGLKNREIAVRLTISEQTVKSHVSRILRKANLASRAQVARVVALWKS